MFGFFGQDGRPPALLVSTIKAAVAIAVLSVLATHWLSDGAFDQSGLSRLASDATRKNEPTTTGSISRAANAVKLDPCGEPRKR